MSQATKSKDGKIRKTFRVHLRLTNEQEVAARNLHTSFQQSVAMSDADAAKRTTFKDYLSILLLDAIRQHTLERDDS